MSFSRETIEKGDAIAVYWHIDDVKSLKNDLTDEQARQILATLKHRHDASIGVNWDVIATTIQMYEEGEL